VPFSLMPTPFLELILNESDSPHVEHAINELHRLRAVQSHLLTHLEATKMQTDACISGVHPLFKIVQPLCDPPAHLSGGRFE
jgi:hypothetical protein